MDIELIDGSKRDLDQLSPDEIAQLHWEQERAFAAAIRQAPRGSEDRLRAFQQGYDTVTKIIARRAGTAAGDGLVMGFSPRYVRLVARLLRKQQKQLRARTGNPQATARLFEIGFGSGVMLEAILRQGFEVAGIEVSENMRQQALRRLPDDWSGNLWLGDFLSLDLPEQSFEVIYWNDVFEHLPPDESLDYLRKIYRLLSPGGVLVTITPNWHMRPSDITGEFRPPRTDAEGFHLKEYTLREMRAVLRDAGFDRVTMPWVVTRQHTLLGGSGGIGLKCCFEPLLERLPFKLTRLLCRGFALSCTLAWKRR